MAGSSSDAVQATVGGPISDTRMRRWGALPESRRRGRETAEKTASRTRGAAGSASAAASMCANGSGAPSTRPSAIHEESVFQTAASAPSGDRRRLSQERERPADLTGNAPSEKGEPAAATEKTWTAARAAFPDAELPGGGASRAAKRRPAAGSSPRRAIRCVSRTD